MSSLATDLRALLAAPRDLWIVYAMKLFESIAYFTVYTLLVIFLSDDLAFSDQAAGTVAGTWLTGVSLLVFVAGFVADAMGVRRALLVAALSAAAGRGLLCFADGPWAVYLALAVSTWGIGTMKPTMNAAVRAYSTPATVAFAFSLYYVVMNLGSMSQGPLISSARSTFAAGADFAGRHWSSSQLVFLVGLGVSVCNVGLALLLREPISPPERPEKNPLKIAAEVMRERVFWIFMAMVGLLTLVRLIFQHAHLTWPKYTLREFGEDFPFAWYWTINPAMIVLLTPFGTAATRHFRPYPVMIAGGLVSALSVFAMAASTTVTASVVFIVTLSLGEALWSPRLYEYTATIAPRGRESSYMGLSEVPLFLAKPFVGYFSGVLLASYCPAEGPRDSQTMWVIIGAMTFIGPALMLLLARVLERRST